MRLRTCSTTFMEFASALCEEVVDSVIIKKHVLPSAMLSSLLATVENTLGNTKLCEDLLKKLKIPLFFCDDEQSAFFLGFFLHFAKETFAYISKTFRGSQPQPNKPPPDLDTNDRQVIYYIGGSIVRGYLKNAYRYKKSKALQEVMKVLKSKLLQDKPTKEQEEDAAWTLSLDRGGLLYITSLCQDFVIALAKVVFSHKKRDGSIDYNDVIKKVSESDISVTWDLMISDSLSESNSLNLMNDVIRCFSRTCCRGFVKRRLNFIKQRPTVSMPTRHAVAWRKKTTS